MRRTDPRAPQIRSVVSSLTIFLITIQFGFAQTTVQIGMGSNAELNRPCPLKSSFTGGSYMRYDIVITESEMLAAGIPTGATITNLQFHKLNASALSKKCYYSLYLANSLDSNLVVGTAWADIMANHKLVHSDSLNVSASAGWETWNVDTPFVYSGNSLKIAGEYVLVATASPSMSWEATVDPVNNPPSKIIYGSGTAFPLTLNGGPSRRPNIRITFTSCPSPSLPTISNITSNSADISWPAVNGTMGYQWVVTTNSTPPVAGTDALDTFAHAQTLTSTTVYYAHIRSNCGTVFSGWRTTSFTTTGCPTPLTATVNGSGPDADISWPPVAGAIGYQYQISSSPSPPMTGTSITNEGFHASGLAGVNTYYIHVRTDCGTGGFSFWKTTSFATACYKPSPFVVSANFRTGTAEIRWNKVNGATEYEYAILPRAAPPVDFSAARTVDTVAYFTGMTPGLTHWFHIRSRCKQGSFSDWASIEFHPSGIEVYPNPTSSKVTIRIHGIAAIDGTIVIMDGTGRIMKKLKLTGFATELDMSAFAAGVYLVKYENYAGYVTRIVKR